MGPSAQPMETPAGKFSVSEILRTDRAKDALELKYFYSAETKSVVKLTANVIYFAPDEVGFYSQLPSMTLDHYEMELIKYGHRDPAVRAPVYADGDWWIFRVKMGDKPPIEYRVTYRNGEFESDEPNFLKEQYPFFVLVHLNHAGIYSPPLGA